MFWSRAVQPVVEAARALIQPDVVGSLPFRKRAMGGLPIEGVCTEVLAFKLAFEQSLWKSAIPFYAVELEPEFVRFDRFPECMPCDHLGWHTILSLGDEVVRARKFSVVRGGHAVGVWQLA